MSDSSDDSEPEIKEEEVATWQEYLFTTAEATLFCHSRRKWMEAITFGKGECGLDTIAVALNFPRDASTYKLLRFGASKNPILTSEQKLQVCKKGEWMDDESLTYVMLKTFQKVPIIINDMYDPFALPLEPPPKKPPAPGPKPTQLPSQSTQAVFKAALLIYEARVAAMKLYESQMQARRNKLRKLPRKNDPPFAINASHTKYMPELMALKGEADLEYVVFKNKGAAHWVTFGMRHKNTAHVRTVFKAKHLPKHLLTRFLEQVEFMRNVLDV